MKKRKIYSKEFKLEALRQWEQGGQSARAVASSLGLPRSALYKWKEQLSQQGKDAFQGLGCRPAGPPDELTRLKKELADVTMERDILKRHRRFERHPVKRCNPSAKAVQDKRENPGVRRVDQPKSQSFVLPGRQIQT